MTNPKSETTDTEKMFDQFDFPQPSAPSKHSNVFDHYAAAQVTAINGGQWSEDVFYSPEQQFQPTPASAMTVSPAELLSTVSTVNNCFSDIEHTPLIEASDIGQDTSSWAPLFSFEDMVNPQPEHTDALLAGNVPIAPHPGTTESQIAVQPETTELEDVQPPSFAKALAMEVDRKLKRKESVSKPRAAGSKVDKHGITVYNRKPRQTPLRPVDIPDNADNATAKRARNTEAARRSRARKMERMSQLEERVHELLQDKELLEAEVLRLRKKCGEA